MSLVLPILLAATHITAANTFYDRKEGYAVFRGNVAVEDSQYQLHADRAFVYTSETNTLTRIVALGHVAITNGTKRAYGAKASYHRDSGLVVLHAGDGITAEVRDETPDGNQTVRGRKIKFWTGTRQVEVVEAELEAPGGGTGLDSAKGLFGR